MTIRRSLLAVTPWAVVALPLWVLIGRGIVLADSSWDLVGYLVLSPVLAIALGAAALLVRLRLRGAPRDADARPDAALLGAWYAAVLAFGLTPEPYDGVVLVIGALLGVATLWYLGWALVRDARRRVRETLAAFEQQARRADAGPGPSVGRTASRGGERVIRMHDSDGGWSAG
jgi:hypothetical protein